ncbi:MAG: hypothetical protein OHK0039_12100 [Bacteroidia bacterium]
MKRSLTFWLGLLPLMILAQPYTVEGGHTRHRFAQLTLGADMLWMPGGGTGYHLQENQPVAYSFGNQLIPRIIIAGTHFWGHADFYVNFPVGGLLAQRPADDVRVSVSPGVETGARVYPWAIRRGAIRLFGGIAFAISDFQLVQGDQAGAWVNRTTLPLQAGITYQRGAKLFDLGVRYALRQPFTYYLDRTQAQTHELPAWGVFLGMKYSLETTLSAEKPYRDGTTQRRVDVLAAAGKLNSFSLAIGPSAAFTLGKGQSTYNRGDRAFLDQYTGSGIFPDAGLGYYHHRWDAHINLAYRAYAEGRRAYDYEQLLRRRSVALEAYKFLFDFHGFVPFVGPHVSWDMWRFEEKDLGQTVHSQTDARLLPGITFGWDIRPDRLQSFILRTNLRYTPYVLDTPGDTRLFLHQLEFNFIQLVIYPQRARALRQQP